MSDCYLVIKYFSMMIIELCMWIGQVVGQSSCDLFQVINLAVHPEELWEITFFIRIYSDSMWTKTGYTLDRF
jgi:hypothetical protein